MTITCATLILDYISDEHIDMSRLCAQMHRLDLSECHAHMNFMSVDILALHFYNILSCSLSFVRFSRKRNFLIKFHVIWSSVRAWQENEFKRIDNFRSRNDLYLSNVERNKMFALWNGLLSRVICWIKQIHLLPVLYCNRKWFHEKFVEL